MVEGTKGEAWAPLVAEEVRRIGRAAKKDK
jgi:hypothetical protein